MSFRHDFVSFVNEADGDKEVGTVVVFRISSELSGVVSRVLKSMDVGSF